MSVLAEVAEWAEVTTNPSKYCYIYVFDRNYILQFFYYSVAKSSIITYYSISYILISRGHNDTDLIQKPKPSADTVELFIKFAVSW